MSFTLQTLNTWTEKITTRNTLAKPPTSRKRDGMDELITFTPLHQQRVWGGRLLETRLGRHLADPHAPFGESWDIVDREEAQSVARSGAFSGLTLHDLWSQHRQAVFGHALLAHPAPRYPLLMKILDAREDLSLQVHPPAEKAAALGGEPKAEMWFIAHAEPGAKIYAGLKSGVTREQFTTALTDGSVADLVHVLEPRTGDCLFIPSGRLHAIGAGLLIYEIQQNSDTTYRVFDWNRPGLDGKPRQLHIEESLASIDFADFTPGFQRPAPGAPLVSCPYFEVHLRSPDHHHLGEPGDSLVIAVVSGGLQAGSGPALHPGDFSLVPASASRPAREIRQSPSQDTLWLEIRIPAIS